jgi:hypothetical protein
MKFAILTRKPESAVAFSAIGFICALVTVIAANPSSVMLKTSVAPSEMCPSPDIGGPRNPAVYVGDTACASCHKEKAVGYRLTAHAQTSGWPSHETIKGKFSPGANALQTGNPGLRYVMDATGSGFTQTAWFQISPATMLNRTETFGVVVGAGRKGQTYLYWDGDDLFQLPVSYWTEVDCWINSPGYPDDKPYFERPTTPRCLECHATSFESRAPPRNRYNKASLLLGMACEKCHGPGSEHVARFSPAAFPSATGRDPAIVNPAKLARERQIDICALCHGGVGVSLTPPLSFRPGDVLAAHVTLPNLAPGAQLDVHASQIQLLERSRCFNASTTMTCSTCHNVHKPQRDPASFASRCLSCHKVENCGMFPRQAHAIDNRCVDCHMPLETTSQIVFNKEGRKVQPKVRNHRIAIYPGVKLP